MSEIFTLPEKQLMTVLSWFRSRYALFLELSLERKANRENIEHFGKVWVGEFKIDWTEAFESLIEKNILKKDDDEYDFTEYGNEIKGKIEAETPFFKYEYDNFFNLEKQSKAHSLFCERVYGKDLSQHGLIDQEELSVLIEKLKKQNPDKILDIGCGNGKITKEIAKEIQAECLGIDISSEGIKEANLQNKQNLKVRFQEGNFNNFLISEKFDATLFLDTLYFADNLTKTVQDSLKLLNKNGRLYAYFSQWIMDEAYNENLKPENTHLGKVLKELNLDFSVTDLTQSGIGHWKKKLQLLEEMKQDFLEENNEALWQYRFREANRYANWGDTKYSRFLYEVKGLL
ncbi:MAG: class I SAM-dependent methyltransferase [Flavobacteriaceae bacterium]